MIIIVGTSNQSCWLGMACKIILPFCLCRQAAADLVEFVSKGTKPGAVAVLIAHNGNIFDNRMLTAEFKRCGMAVPQTWQWMDSLPLARELLPQLTR